MTAQKSAEQSSLRATSGAPMPAALSRAEAAISSAHPSVEGWQWVPVVAKVLALFEAAPWLRDSDNGVHIPIFGMPKEAQVTWAELYQLSAAPVPPQKGDSMDNDPPLLGGLATGVQRSAVAVAETEALIRRSIEAHDSWAARVAMRCALGDAAAICDIINHEILRERSANGGTGKPSVLGKKLAEIATRCGDRIFAVRSLIDTTGDSATQSEPGTPVVSNTPDEAAVVHESSPAPLDVRADMLAALEPLANIPLWRDTYPDAKSDVLAAQQMRGYINVEDVCRARAVIARAKGGQPCS